jgi:hypothetical protein
MTEYIDGQGLAAIHISALKLPVGFDANYYYSGGILLIGSLLGPMFTEGNL